MYIYIYILIFSIDHVEMLYVDQAPQRFLLRSRGGPGFPVAPRPAYGTPLIQSTMGIDQETCRMRMLRKYEHYFRFINIDMVPNVFKSEL